ncbi:MAG: 4-hydroxy-3-methylbut-2-enyl diphosphate reductase [Flavobacteriales bacterium]|nr:4-hydroxy-3-methylbut-2-enyl diphosphate reductase [Flavobacteriales bacterium]
MKITIDENSGFCFGVVYAIEMAENILENEEKLYCLGDIVHNNKEIDRLSRLGLEIIDHKRLNSLSNCRVLIRAHGEPPSTYEVALRNNIELLDASCPVVLKLQHQIKEGYEKAGEVDGQIIIYGKEGHAEVIGLVGQTNGEAIIVTTKEDLYKIDYKKPIYIYSQTTKSPKAFQAIIDEIKDNLSALGRNDDLKFVVHDTLCRQVSGREPQLKQFASENDVILFVSGTKSSNGKMLFTSCKDQNKYSYFISDVRDINKDWFKDAVTVGICGATSTPRWLMNNVATHINKY